MGVELFTEQGEGGEGGEHGGDASRYHDPGEGQREDQQHAQAAGHSATGVYEQGDGGCIHGYLQIEQVARGEAVREEQCGRKQQPGAAGIERQFVVVVAVRYIAAVEGEQQQEQHGDDKAIGVEQAQQTPVAQFGPAIGGGLR